MPELSYLRDQHTAMPQPRTVADLDALLQRETSLSARCGRSVLQSLAVPPSPGNAEMLASRMQALQQEHDAFLMHMERPDVTADVWKLFEARWRAVPILDINVLCEYCAEAGRDVRKRIRSGKISAEAVTERVRAICLIGRLLPDAAVCAGKALRDFYQQGILDTRRIRAAMCDMGMDTAYLDETIIMLTERKRRLAL